MKPGKLSESVLKRSVLKQIKTKREEIIVGAGVGADCSFFVWKEKEGGLLTTSTIAADSPQTLESEIIAAVNNVAAAGGEPVAVLSGLLLPDKIPESELQRYLAVIEKACEGLEIQIAGGDTRITKAVSKPVLSLTVLGKKEIQGHKGFNEYQGEEDIILTKWVALAGTSILAEKKEERLRQRLPGYFIDRAKKMRECISVLPESRIGSRMGVVGMHDVSRGGIFAALWELVEDRGVGLEVDLRKLPIRQETIEICEILEVNPYELYGAGALLMVTNHAGRLLRELEKEGIPAAVIGKIKKDISKIILNGEEKRYLERPCKEALEVLREEKGA